MKKFATAIVCLCTLFALSACQPAKSPEATATLPAETKQTVSTPSIEPTVTVTVQPSASPAAKISVKEYLENDEVKQSVAQLSESFASLGITVECAPAGDNDDKLAYIYTYTTAIPEEKLEATAAALESQLASQADTMKSVAASLQSAGVDASAVVVIYKNADGSVIYQTEFTAD